MSWRLRDHVSMVRTDYGAVLLDEQHGRYWQLNATGTTIVSALAEGGSCSAEEIQTQLLDEFEVSAERAGTDVADLLTGLGNAGLALEDRSR